jgi:hypothetical protein
MIGLALAVLIGAGGPPAHQPASGRRSVGEYVATLQQIRALVAARKMGDAQYMARQTMGVEVDSPAGTFHSDDALLGEIRPKSLTHLDATIRELQRIAPSANQKADPRLLDALARDEVPRTLREDGKVNTDIMSDSALSAFADHFAKARKWIWKKISDFFDWVEGFWPRRSLQQKSSANMRWIVIVVAVIIALTIGILAFEAARRSRRVAKNVTVSVAPVASARDEDPLSRGANEWEIYAGRLAAAGRYREAIRAWFHAVLVTLYGAAILHFRKGRTNWEYVAALAPSLAWRRDFIELTRRFESEWYGHDESSADALDDCSGRAKTILDGVRRAARGAA